MNENRHLKMFVLNFIVGAGFFTTSLLLTMVIGSLLGTPLRGTVEDLGTAAGTLNIALLLTVIFSFIVTGTLVWFWAKSRIWIGKHLLGMENIGAEPKVETRKTVGLIMTVILLGIITSLIMVGFNSFIAKVSPTADLSSPVTLWTALTQYDLMLLVSVILTIVILGAIVTALGHIIYPLQHRLDKASP